jgi:integrase
VYIRSGRALRRIYIFFYIFFRFFAHFSTFPAPAKRRIGKSSFAKSPYLLRDKLVHPARFEPCDPQVGTPLQRKNLTDRHFKPLIKKAKVTNIRLYDLRHTTATRLLSAGENPKVVSERLGHASIVLTLNTYSHVLPTMQQSATDKLEKIMFGK